MKRTFAEMSYPAPNVQQTPPQTPEHGQVTPDNNQQQAPLHGGNLVVGNNPQTPEHGQVTPDNNQQQAPLHEGNQFHPLHYTPEHGPLFGSPTSVGHFIFTPLAITPVGTPNQQAEQHAGIAEFYAQNGIIPMGNQHQGGEVVINTPHDGLNIVEVMQGNGAIPLSTPESGLSNGDIAQVMQGDQGIQLFPHTPGDSDSDSTSDESSANESDNGIVRNLFNDFAIEDNSDTAEESNTHQQAVINRYNGADIINPFTGQAFESVFGPDSDEPYNLVQGVEEMHLDGETTSESGDSNKEDDQEILGQTNHGFSDGYISDE
ncbi:MAG: hypothetical protein N4A31_02805 [Rickettsiales bacterium]|jgi:hypothetical protein|nr:hypothetical protein [Rickettsiales bacterium]